MLVWLVYLHGAAVALLSSLHEAVPADWRSHHTLVVRFIQQAAEAAARQVFLIVVVAAATESARNIPAEEINNTFFPHQLQSHFLWIRRSIFSDPLSTSNTGWSNNINGSEVFN